MRAKKTLNDVKPGEFAVVKAVNAEGGMRRRLMDIGLIEGTRVECVGKSSGGSLIAFLIRGAVIAIRTENCREVSVKE